MTVIVHTGSSVETVEIEPGESLLDAINRSSIKGFDAPCGGKGLCGKCKVHIKNPPAPDGIQLRFVSAEELSSGVRLACRVFPETDMAVTVDSRAETAEVLTSFAGDIVYDVSFAEPVCRTQVINLPSPSIEDQRSDCRRLADALSSGKDGADISVPLSVKRKLPVILRENSYKLKVKSVFDTVTGISAVGGTEVSYAAAVDIGTTTVVAYLVPLSGPGRGRVADVVSGLNSQKGYGADVISRIDYCMHKEGNLEELRQRITGQVSAMINELCRRNALPVTAVDLVTAAGNTSMTHIFSGLDPRGIATAPFIAADTDMIVSPAGDFGLEVSDECYCVVLPAIAAYVGSDIAAGIAATSLQESTGLSLFIDIGTNGEIVLGGVSGMTACSTAAGPALEGANISCGMGGVPGAINKLVAVEKGESEVFSFSVIGGGEPRGLCGSGIVDAVALFIEAGVIDETGRIQTVSELAEAGIRNGWIECITEQDGIPAVMITKDIIMTQKDIREIQTAKAAIFAGIKTLLSESGKNIDDIKTLYIAGGFGAAINSHSAAIIGLYPKELESSVVLAGNTAGKGAVMAALSKKTLSDIRKIADGVRYVELSASVLFQKEYMAAMYF